MTPADSYTTGIAAVLWGNRSIFAKQVGFYLLVILLISGLSIYLFFSTTTVFRKHLEDQIGTKLEYISRIAAQTTPPERLDLIRAGADESRMVLRLEQRLMEILEARGAEQIYVFRPDLKSLLDAPPRVPIGHQLALPHLSDELFERLAGGQSVHTNRYLSPNQVDNISAYAPVMDAEEKLIAIVGVDAGLEELEIIEQLRTRLYWMAAASIGAGVLLALFLARSISSPVRNIAETARRLGSGDYEARVDVYARDEVGELAVSVNLMAEQIRNRDAALKEMAASVAHEIRNPLNSIRLLITLLEEELRGHAVAEATRQTTDTLKYEVGKLNRFIDEFLTYARPLTLIRDRVGAGDLVAGVVDMTAAEAKARNVEVRLQIEPDLAELVVDRQPPGTILAEPRVERYSDFPRIGRGNGQGRVSRRGRG